MLDFYSDSLLEYVFALFRLISIIGLKEEITFKNKRTGYTKSVDINGPAAGATSTIKISISIFDKE